MDPISVTVISHACVLPANQKVWARVAQHPDISLRLIAPTRWKSSLHGVLEFAALPELQERARGVRVYLSGHPHLHYYSDLGPELTVEVPDIVFIDEDAHSVVAWQLIGIQAIMSFETVAALKQNVLKKYPFPFSLIERAIFRSTAAGAATSEECLEVARTKHFRRPAEIVHYPIDVDLLHPAAPPPDPTGRPFRVGYAGRFVPEKGLADLLQACARVQEQRDLELHLAGAGPQRKQLTALAESLPALRDRVQWAEIPHPQMPDWYRSLDLLVLPSHTTRRWKEQFGRVLAEALACGVPVVGSSSGFIPELIAQTGGGLVYPEGDVPALADAILRLAQDDPLRREAARRGRERVVELYSIEAVAEKLVQLLLSVPLQ